jgi:oligopeptide transport system ATP-binding protein
MNTRPTDILLKVDGLRKSFRTGGMILHPRERWVTVVDGVSFAISRGRALGLVGESGCGKTTVARCVARLIRPTSGRVIFDGEDITGLDDRTFFPFRARMQMVFQDPRSSLDPRMTIHEILLEPLRIHHGRRLAHVAGTTDEALELVGLSRDDRAKYPHMFSGGQQQRIAIARALILRPELVILDEPTSALDVIIQTRLLRLLRDLKERLRLTFLFISHDMRAVGFSCDEVAVMYLGVIVELAPTRRIFQTPYHPYTQGLLAAMPTPDPTRAITDLVHIGGDVGDPGNVPAGCRFRTRCPVAIDGICDHVPPPVVEVATGHFVACHHYGATSRPEPVASPQLPTPRAHR